MLLYLESIAFVRMRKTEKGFLKKFIQIFSQHQLYELYTI
jgi:hypothetical protein